MMLTYCLVIFLGLGSAFYFVTLQMVEILTDKVSVNEREVLRNVMLYSDDRLRDVRRIFTTLYQPQFFDNNTSVIDYLNPVKKTRVNEENKFAVLSAFLQNTCNANSFIADIFIVDYHEKKVFFRSNIPGRGASSDYDFYSLDFLKREGINTAVEIVPAGIPYHINTVGNNFPVISYCIYLFDKNFIRFDSPLGLAVINVRADFFKNSYVDFPEFKGNIFVINNDGICLFDSEDKLPPGKLFPFAEYMAGGLEDLPHNDNYIISIVRSEESGFTFLNILDKQAIVEETEAIRHNIIAIITICVLVTVLISLLSTIVFSRRINTLVRNMRKVESGKLDTRIAVSSNDELGYLEHSFNTMCIELEKYIKIAYVFELKTRTAELKALQAQINPHFLFNTLESIRITALLNQDLAAAKMIHILGGMFRWNIKVKGMFVKLSEEIEYINSYLELQKLRYDDAFSICIDIPHTLQKLGVPKLILQPLVENAIQHGFNGKISDAFIEIKASLDNEKLILTVSDNGAGMDNDKIIEVTRGLSEIPSESDFHNIGLSNVQQRLSILFGDGYDLKISGKLGEGVKIALAIPALSKEELERYVQGSNSR